MKKNHNDQGITFKREMRWWVKNEYDVCKEEWVWRMRRMSMKDEKDEYVGWDRLVCRIRRMSLKDKKDGNKEWVWSIRRMRMKDKKDKDEE